MNGAKTTRNVGKSTGNRTGAVPSEGQRPNSALVVGAGFAGLSAARTLADLGWRVVLVEQQGHLGGHGHHWACMATEACARCSACAVSDLIQQVIRDPAITVRTTATLAALEGADGSFVARLQPVGSSEAVCRSHPNFALAADESIPVSKVVIATGFQPFDPAELPMLNYGRLPNVLTLAEMDDVLREDRLAALITGEKSKLAFIQCVGSRDRERGREYCSQFCCKGSIRLARKLLNEKPDLQITIYYIDLQLTGKAFRVFYKETRDKISFVQGTPAEILPAVEGPGLRVKAYDPATGAIGYEEHDVIVLAAGQRPGPANAALAANLGLKLGEDGFLALARSAHSTASSRPGVFLAGASAGPTDLAMACTQAFAAAAEIGAPDKSFQTDRPLLATGSLQR
ncbi:MAG: CoB--CoM heterodisulfide reductase iron-sulfur subunit A family protein [Deltaproteobacteria bacterium]|nr:CoB--CoM heterodisulfide reductase iron-sulfur subunit A family protein [Deltaproteobacteria bacterium]